MSGWGQLQAKQSLLEHALAVCQPHGMLNPKLGSLLVLTALNRV